MRNSKSYVTAFKQNKLIKPLKNEFSPDNFGSPSITENNDGVKVYYGEKVKKISESIKSIVRV